MRQYRKGVRYSPKTEFQPGITPANKMRVGSITVRIDKNDKERSWIKIAEPNIWKPLSAHVWESHNGQIPEGRVVHHMDGNSLNDDIGNLKLVTRSEHVRIHRDEMQSKRPSLTHKKEKICPDCGLTWMGRGRQICRCEICQTKADKISKQAYKTRNKKAG